MPAYLLDRGERAVEQLDATSSGGESSGSSSDDEDEDEERRAERRQEREREQNEAKAKRAREAAEWDAAHGAEREAQHAALSAEQPDFYWALACEIGRRPKWQLRKGDCLEADATCVMAQDEPLLLYRGFHCFRPDGDVLKASQIFSRTPDFEWLDAERTRLEQGPTAATRSSQPCCVECGQRGAHECSMCPAAGAPIREDPYGGASADWNPLAQAGRSTGWRSRSVKRSRSGLSGGSRQQSTS